MSSTTIFLGGTAAWAAFSWARSCDNSASLVTASFSVRSAKSRRAFSNVSMSAARLLYSSLEPKAPLNSTTDPNTSYSASRLR